MRLRTDDFIGLILTLAITLSGWLLLLVSDAAPAAANLRVVSPPINATAYGVVTFAVWYQDVPGLASVEYLLNGRSLSGPLYTTPYSYTWNSYLVWDGPATLQAIGRDIAGAVIAQSTAVPFTVSNLAASIQLVSPAPTQVCRGTMRCSVNLQRTMSAAEIAWLRANGRQVEPFAVVIFFVDGQRVGWQWDSPQLPTSEQGPVTVTHTAAIDFDTTLFANGPHELFISANNNVNMVGDSFTDMQPVAMIQKIVTFDNGQSVRAVRPRWSGVFLVPGENISLSPYLLNTDSTKGNLSTGVTYSSANSVVATVDAGGVVHAVAVGVTTITVSYQGSTATTRAVVLPSHVFPHFSRDGHILTAYDPARSQFLRSIVDLNPDRIDDTPGLAEAAHGAAINALTVGFYRNPVESGNPPDLDAWRQQWEPWWNHTEQVANANNFSLVLTGDDTCRTAAELSNSITNPWSANAIQVALTRARDSGRTVCIELMDEANFWGDTPAPTDGRWLTENPPIPDNAFLTLMKIINGVSNRPPVTWPVSADALPSEAANWMGDPRFADYSSVFVTLLQAVKNTFPEGSSLWQKRNDMDTSVLGRYPLMQLNAPSLMLVRVLGVEYRKQTPGAAFQPGVDALQTTGISPVNVAAQVMYAAAMGQAGVHTYGYTGQWRQQRQDAPIGDGDLETRIDPFVDGTDRWQALASAFNLIQRLEPNLLQPQISAVDLGPTFVTGARQGPASRLLIAVNFSERAEAVTVDLSPYQYAGGPAIIRYRLVGAQLSTDTLPNGDIDTVTFAPGEGVVWLFRPVQSGDVTPPTIQLSAPLAESTVAERVIVQAAVADDTKVDRVEFFVNGRTVATLNAAPYAFTWDTTGLTPGIWYGLSAVAYDSAGNASEARIPVRVAPP